MKTNIKRKTTAIILGLLFSIILLEIGIRLVGFVFLSLQDYRNRLAIKQKGSYRILCLGDSMTAGMYPRPLEEILNEKSQELKFTVIDRGFPGTNSEYTIATLNENLYKYSPDVVIIMIGINDRKDKVPYGNISISKKMPFRTYKLAGIFWHHILSKAGKGDIGQTSQLDKFNLREDECKKRIEMNPDDPYGYINLGWYYINNPLKNPAKSEEMFKKAIQIDPRNDEAYFGLAMCYYELGEYDKIKKMVKKAIEINPQNSLANILLAHYYWTKGEYDKSEKILRKTIQELNIESKIWKLNAFIELGWCYRELGKFDKAEEIIKKAIKIYPEDNSVYAILGVLYEQQGKHKPTEEYFEKANTSRREFYTPMTRRNYQKIKKILTQRKIKLVAMQYPMRSVEPLKKLLEPNEGVIFVDNERTFKTALTSNEYFKDTSAGDFGHCNSKGNRLLAENIARVILKDVFNQ